MQQAQTGAAHLPTIIMSFIYLSVQQPWSSGPSQGPQSWGVGAGPGKTLVCSLRMYCEEEGKGDKKALEQLIVHRMQPTDGDTESHPSLVLLLDTVRPAQILN